MIRAKKINQIQSHILFKYGPLLNIETQKNVVLTTVKM